MSKPKIRRLTGIHGWEEVQDLTGLQRRRKGFTGQEKCKWSDVR